MTVSHGANDAVSTEDGVIDVPDPILEIRDLTVAFQMDRGVARVSDQISIDIDRNEIVGIVGESGSGKSMFADALLDAVVEPGVTSGEITYNPRGGDPVDVLNLSRSELREFRWERISMVFQGAMSSFNPVRTIHEHFVETLSAHDYNVKEGLERAVDLLSQLYLEPRRVLESYPHELSGGMQQRVLIALSLILEPDVLVMDEPTAALDLLMQRSIISLIDEIQERHDLTIVFITHDLPLIADLADRLAVLYAFEFVEFGPADEILADAAHPYTRALLNSTPNLSTDIENMRPIEGESPDPVLTPDGCSYHDRCPLADDHCKTVDPGAYYTDPTHVSYCHYWEDARDTVPAVEMEPSDAGTVDSVDRSTGSTPRGTTDEPILSLNDVEVHFDNGDDGFLGFGADPETVYAVDGVSLDIYENDVVVLVGESGCGKTTLGKTAVGLQRPTGGSVEYRGQDVWQARDLLGEIDIPYEDIRQSLQIIHQDPGSALNAHRRVRAILEAPLKRWHPELNNHDRRERILGMLQYVGMNPPTDYIDRYPFQLSGGEQQRVAMIRALLMNPALILADEAVSALDVSLRVEMMDLMLELQDDFDTSFLCISHDLSNARYIAEKAGGRIGVMYLGELVEIGPPERIIDDPRHPYTQALRWATPELDVAATEKTDEQPMRKIDIPDSANPPSGCRYHTRCPEARAVCSSQHPGLQVAEDGDEHGQRTACFREYDDDHEYWTSPSIVEEEADD